MQFVSEDVEFTIGENQLKGILTKPEGNGPYPAVVLLHGSDRSGREDAYYTENAEKLVESGYAVLRYDGPGWGGQSSGGGLETFEYRCEEAIGAVKFLQSRPDITSHAVGLWGISQGGWICQMAAAQSDQVAFIIPVSGPGVTPGEQEVYRVVSQAKAEGFSEEQIQKAGMMRKLLVDIVMPEQPFKDDIQSTAEQVGDGPWNNLIDLVYQDENVDPAEEMGMVIKTLNLIKDEQWTKPLYLEQVLPMFESLPPQAWDMVKGQMRMVMDVNPANYLPKVSCPVLAIFGEADTSVPVEKSVARYEQYLGEAGNQNVTIKVFPNASHTIKINNEFAPGYFDLMIDWLKNLHL